MCVYVCACVPLWFPKTREIPNRFHSNFPHALLSVLVVSSARIKFNSVSNGTPEQSIISYFISVLCVKSDTITSLDSAFTRTSSLMTFILRGQRGILNITKIRSESILQTIFYSDNRHSLYSSLLAITMSFFNINFKTSALFSKTWSTHDNML